MRSVVGGSKVAIPSGLTASPKPSAAMLSNARVMPIAVWKMSRLATRWLYLIILAQIQDTCKKWSQGGRLAVAGAPGDFADDPTARSAGDLTLNLADAEVGGRSEHLDLGDDALRCCR